LHCNIVFFDGFKAIEAIGGVHPNGISMDKDERLAFSSCKYLCCYLMSCKTQRILEFRALFSAISEFL